MLLQKGADPKVRDGDNLTPAMLAKKLGGQQLYKAFEVERRNVKLSPLLGPMQKKINTLELEHDQHRLTLTKTEPALVTLQTSHRKGLTAVSKAIASMDAK